MSIKMTYSVELTESEVQAMQRLFWAFENLCNHREKLPDVELCLTESVYATLRNKFLVETSNES